MKLRFAHTITKSCLAHFMGRVFALLLLTAVTSCDVHEFPQAPASDTLILRISYDASMTEWNHQYVDKQIVELGYGDTYDNSRDHGTIRYIAKIYPLNEKFRATDTPIAEYVFYRDIADGYDCEYPLDIEPGSYTVRVWSDLIENTNDSYFYNADDFNEISLQGEHQGNNDYRDAFRGSTDVTIKPLTVEHEPQVVEVAMSRPLAKYEFYATDFKEFVDKEFSRYEEMYRTTGASVVPDNLYAETLENIKNYKVIFRYTRFMPCSYNMFTSRPADSATGVAFESSLSQLSHANVHLGSDYVFVNGSQASVSVSIEVHDHTGTLVSRTAPFEVPLYNSRHTIIAGEFLTQHVEGSVGISPGYDGEWNIPI